MENSIEIKKVVRNKYAEIANKSNIKSQSSCGCCGTDKIVETDYSVFNDNYENLDGYVAEADLNLGCGLPTEYAGINIGNTVVDLGSGAGNDVFVSRALVGNEGRVIGIDFTEEMISKAEMNNNKLGFKNVEFKSHNLAQDGSFSQFDLIICRNVLIYFNSRLQERVIQLFSNSLNNGGYLGIGSKESIIWCKSVRNLSTLSLIENIYRKNA